MSMGIAGQIIDFTNGANIAQLIVVVLILIAFDVCFFLSFRRVFPMIVVSLLEVLMVISWIFTLPLFLLILFALSLILAFVYMLLNLGQLREFGLKLAHFFVKLNPIKKKTEAPKPIIIDRSHLFDEIGKAVRTMSKSKTGALITFIKNDDILDESKWDSSEPIITQKGVDINCPVSAELIETIFYEGTRLHDGAVVIRNDKIVRASVFFKSTAKALTGKYGSRHQAAIGISENSDSVTIIVSEETGRIGIAYRGEITPVMPDNFIDVLEEDLTSVEENEEKRFE